MEAKVMIKKLHERAVIPAYATPSSAGMDLYALLDEEIELMPSQRATIPTGIQFSCPTQRLRLYMQEADWE